MISLARICHIIEHGFVPDGQRDPVAVESFSAGYGQKSLLIPRAETTAVQDVRPGTWRRLSTRNADLPPTLH